MQHDYDAAFNRISQIGANFMGMLFIISLIHPFSISPSLKNGLIFAYICIKILEMKNYILLFLAFTLSLSSCKMKRIKNPRPEYIIGDWKLERLVIEGITYPVNDCIRRSFMHFSSNHDAHSIFYTVNETTNVCEKHLEHWGEWVFENDSWYIIVHKENTHEMDPPIRKEMIFTDPDHAYTFGEVEGYHATLYFVKVD